MKVLDHMDEKVKISRYPKVVAYTELDVGIKLPRMDEFDGGWKDISNIFADEMKELRVQLLKTYKIICPSARNTNR